MAKKNFRRFSSTLGVFHHVSRSEEKFRDLSQRLSSGTVIYADWTASLEEQYVTSRMPLPKRKLVRESVGL